MSCRISLNVIGEPSASFSNSEWKEKVYTSAVALPTPSSDINGTHLIFRVSQLRNNGPDTDNLCHCVFSSLTKAGWFGGKKPNIRWWYSERRLRGQEPAGLTLVAQESPIYPECRSILFSETYTGLLPTHSRDKEYVDWIKKCADRLGLSPSEIPINLGVAIYLGTDKENIGEIPTGRIKNIIDGLHPIIGSDDTKIDQVFVQKNVIELQQTETKIIIWMT